MSNLTLNSPIRQIPKIGEVFEKRLNRLGIKTAGDLLYYFPFRYEDFSDLTPIAKLKLNQKCSILGKILSIESSRSWKRKLPITEAIVQGKTGAIKAVWFGKTYLYRTLKQGDLVCLAGKPSLSKDGISLSNPIYEKITSYEGKELAGFTHTQGLIPIYPETRGLTSRFLRWVIKDLLKEFKGKIPEVLPQEVIRQNELSAITEAIEQIHFPKTLKKAEKARERFSFEELFLIGLTVLSQRLKLNKEKAPKIEMDVPLMQKLVKSLGFKLTDAQRKCAYQILRDLEKGRPMSRLLEGDVGSGKTVVAVMALLNTVKAGFQTALMAPTEILAKQHFQEVSKLLQPFKVKIALLTGKQDKIISQKLGYKTKAGFKPEVLEISRNKILEKAKAGEIDVLIGTHALIQEKVKFGNLGLAVVDEQHRFGVKQRAKIITKKRGQAALIPHFLSMTATPIPRTLALTVYGDLDLSIINEMPKGRKEVATKVVSPKEREKTYQFIKTELKKGRQAFVICPRIENPQNVEPETWNAKPKTNADKANRTNSGWSDVKAVKEEYERLEKDVFPDFKIEMLHGKMKAKEKEKIMERFRRGKFDILVSTSVVEVGVDVPKAAVMVIEGSDRFGLAQLYQFRGRVGRSDIQSYCFLFTDSSSQKTKQRLLAIVKAKNGFELAQKDLEIRGPGSLYGVKQWGLPDIAMESLKDISLVERTREQAKEVLFESPDLKKYPLLGQRVGQYTKQIHFE